MACIACKPSHFLAVAVVYPAEDRDMLAGK